MRRFLVALSCCCVLVLLGSNHPLAVYNGAADGTGHPAVGFVLGAKGPDPCDYNAQAIGCSGVLIAPDLFLSTGDCTDSVKDSIATGFIDDGWIILDAEGLVAGETEPALDCSKFIHIESYDINPEYLATGNGDVGVMTLAVSQSIAPVSLPPVRDLRPKPRKRLPDITPVSFGELADAGAPGGFDIFTLKRRLAHASFGTLGAELHTATFDPVAGSDRPCVGFLTRGGPAFETDTNQVFSLAKYPNGTCDITASFQRLDVPSVRNFLANYVTLP